MNQVASCPFCDIARASKCERIVNENEHAFVIKDGYPVTIGHSLIILKRHVGSFFDTTQEEKLSVLELLDQTKAAIDIEHNPDAYNMGINDGAAAGQTVPHLHIHLIPRYEEQDKDPKGGVRWVIPGKADYWSKQ